MRIYQIENGRPNGVTYKKTIMMGKSQIEALELFARLNDMYMKEDVTIRYLAEVPTDVGMIRELIADSVGLFGKDDLAHIIRTVEEAKSCQE